jgi:hypothetical protein
VGVSPDIVEDLSRTGERSLGIDHPLSIAGWCQIAPERRGFMQVTMFGKEAQFAGGERFSR